MPRKSIGFISAAATAAIILVALSTPADIARAAEKKDKEQPAQLTIGGLAQRLVSEMALNSPVGGYDPSFSIGVMTYIGYEGGRDAAAPATVADMQAMLESVGVKTTTSRPGEPLTGARADATLNAVRSSLPRFEVPEGRNKNRRGGREAGRSSNTKNNEPCSVTFHTCRRDCLQKSPSGRSGGVLGGCIQECREARKECRRGFENAIHIR